MEDFAVHSIPYYNPISDENDDPDIISEDKEVLVFFFTLIQSKMPFAVIGSNEIITSSNGQKVRGRQYPWGSIEVENETHCDFVKLRNMLIRTHMEDLKDHTSNVLYENFRINRIDEIRPLEKTVNTPA
jgi:septin 7